MKNVFYILICNNKTLINKILFFIVQHTCVGLFIIPLSFLLHKKKKNILVPTLLNLKLLPFYNHR